MFKYLDRALVISPVHIVLCTSEKEFLKEKKRRGIREEVQFLGKGAGASTHTWGNDEVQTCIVCIDIKVSSTKKLEQVHALLTHEAVHVWQFIREQMGESNPSSEFEAYAIQSITQNLLLAYNEAVRRNR